MQIPLVSHVHHTAMGVTKLQIEENAASTSMVATRRIRMAPIPARIASLLLQEILFPVEVFANLNVGRKAHVEVVWHRAKTLVTATRGSMEAMGETMAMDHGIYGETMANVLL
jgi:hypothetical protein